VIPSRKAIFKYNCCSQNRTRFSWIVSLQFFRVIWQDWETYYYFCSRLAQTSRPHTLQFLRWNCVGQTPYHGNYWIKLKLEFLYWDCPREKSYFPPKVSTCFTFGTKKTVGQVPRKTRYQSRHETKLKHAVTQKSLQRKVWPWKSPDRVLATIITRLRTS